MVASQNIPSAQTQTEDPLRYTFVEMLFALAVSQVAMCVSDIIGAPGAWLSKIPGLAHLILSLFVIAASWVGWRHSQSPGMKQQIVSIFSLRFIGLLVDVLLVILYFVLVKSVELEQVGGNPKLSTPSATSESIWIVVIFGTYAAWDLIADVFSNGSIPPTSMVGRLWIGLRVAIVCSLASCTCLLLCYVVLRFSESVAGVLEVAAFDAALLAVVLLFRVLKAVERPLSSLARVADCKAFCPPRVLVGNELLWAIALLGIYGLALLLATRKLPWLPIL